MYPFVIKRLLDFLISLIIIPLLLFIIIPVAIAIKIEDKGSVFYLSTRLGKDMKPLLCTNLEV